MDSNKASIATTSVFMELSEVIFGDSSSSILEQTMTFKLGADAWGGSATESVQMIVCFPVTWTDDSGAGVTQSYCQSMSAINPAGNLAGTASGNQMIYAVWPWVADVPKFGNAETITYQMSVSAVGSPFCTPAFYDPMTKTIGSVACVASLTNVPFDSVTSATKSKFDANTITLGISMA